MMIIINLTIVCVKSGELVSKIFVTFGHNITNYMSGCRTHVNTEVQTLTNDCVFGSCHSSIMMQ